MLQDALARLLNVKRTGEASERQAVQDALDLSPVLPVQQNGNRQVTAGSIGTVQLGDGAVTLAKLAAATKQFDRVNAGTKAAFYLDGRLEPYRGNQAAAACISNGVFIRQPGLANTATVLNGVLGATVPTNISTGASVDWAAGDTLQVVCKLAVTGFANLAAGKLAGIEFHLAADSTGVFDKTTVGTRRITVGMDSAGDIFVVTADGTNVTATDTGIDAVSGTTFVVRITFTKGTSVVVSIDGAADTTVATTLPSRLGAWAFGSSNATVTPVTSYDWHGGAYAIQGSD